MAVNFNQHYDIFNAKYVVFQSQTLAVGLTADTVTSSSTVFEILNEELLPENGYDRTTHTIGGGTIYAGDLKMEFPAITATFTASGGSLNWSSAFLLLYGSGTPSHEFTNSNVNASTNRITITSHGLSNAERVIVNDDGISTLPGGLAEDTFYWVKSIDANTIELYSDVGLTSIIDLTSTGAGTFYLRNAKGSVLGYITESSPVTLLDGNSYSYQFTITEYVYNT